MYGEVCGNCLIMGNVDEYEDRERSKEEYMVLKYNRWQYIRVFLMILCNFCRRDGRLSILWSSEFVVHLLLSRWYIPSGFHLVSSLWLRLFNLAGKGKSSW